MPHTPLGDNMSATATRTTDTPAAAKPGTVDMKLEVITLPVSDPERAKEFYTRLGWRLDADFRQGDAWAIQFTPPGSPCSIHFGKNLTTAVPGSVQNLWLVVSDIEAARADLLARGVDVSEVFHFASFNRIAPGARLSGPAPERHSYGSFVSFSDPDGNGWVVQEITTRLPGRVAGDTTYASAADLKAALWRAALAHGEHEKRTGGVRDENWPEWYAAYMVAEQAGTELPS
jgi:catechol 2,3-dioxygenase-like lactoylglutathione lyase family enzyme